MCFSSAVAHLLHDLMCCAFRDAFLYTLLLTSGYLSYCCIPATPKHLGQSLQISDVNKAFSASETLLIGYIFLYYSL